MKGINHIKAILAENERWSRQEYCSTTKRKMLVCKVLNAGQLKTFLNADW